MVEWNLDTVSISESSISVAQIGRVINTYPRPCVLINERELSVLRRGLTKDGWKRTLYLQPAGLRHKIYAGAGMLSTANQWLEREIDIPKAEDDTPCDMRHKQLAGAALALALVYNIEKEKTYSDKAADILREYAHAYPDFQPDAGESVGGMIRSSGDEAACAIALAQAYDLIYYSRSLSEKEKEHIETQLFARIAESFRDLGCEGASGAQHISAIGVIGMAVKDANMAAYALAHYSAWTHKNLFDGGLYPKSTHTTHFAVLSSFLHLAEAFFRGGIDIFSLRSKDTASLKAMFSAPLGLMYPSFRLPAKGCGDYDAFVPLDLYEVAYRRWGDSDFAWALRTGYKLATQDPIRFSRSGFYAMLFGRDLPGRSAAPILRSRYYPALGICSLRNEKDLMATVNCASGEADGHMDNLGFTLFTDNQVAVPDYGSPECVSEASEWFGGSLAHNTVVVDGKSQLLSGQNDPPTLCTGTFLQGVQVRSNDHYPGVSHTRRIVMLDGVCIVHDVLKSNDKHDYDWIMRCEGIPNLRSHHETCTVEQSSTPMLEWENAYKMGKSFRIDWELASSELALTMWHIDGEGEFAIGNCAAETASRRVKILRCRRHGNEAGFLAVLVPSHVCEDVLLKKDGNVITLTTRNSVDYLYVRGCGIGEESIMETDGEFAAVRMAGNAIKSAVLSHGSWLKWNGAPVLECPSETGCLEVSFEDRGPQIKYRGGTTGIVKVKTNARALRVNGYRAPTSNSDGYATLRVAEHMIETDQPPERN
ncbi:MAG: heparinase II/III family protein [Armatimonadota bacterium]|nr:heparinase II/III-family protein [bacterium]